MSCGICCFNFLYLLYNLFIMSILDKFNKVLGGLKPAGGQSAPAEPVITEDPVPVDSAGDIDGAKIILPSQQDSPAILPSDMVERENQAREAARQLEKDLADGSENVDEVIKKIGGTMK